MNKNELIKKIEENWLIASKRLNFEIIIPYLIPVEKIEKEVFAYLPKYGSKKGIIIGLTSPSDFETDNELIKWAKINQYAYSFINVEEYVEYDEALIIETLEDWGRL